MTAAVFLILLFAAVPIGLVLILSAMWYIWDSNNVILYESFAQQLFSGLENYGLLAIPLFMLTGELMNEGGLTPRLIQAARVFVGGFRGGLVYINLLANMFMASIMGSAASQIAIMTRAMVPAMEKEGYNRDFATATTAAGGLLSPIIPPSMLFVIYGVIAQLPIGDMFIAGIIPGLILALAFFIIIALIGLRQQFPKGNWMAWNDAKKALIYAVPAGLIPVAIIGGILFGIATPTESATIASLIAFIMGRFIYRDLDMSHMGEIFIRTAVNSSLVVFMIAAANVFGWVIIYEALPQKLTVLITTLTQDPFMFLLIINLLLLMIGMVLDGIAAVILVAPLILPIATGTYNIDPYQLGVVMCLNLVLGLLTPPVGAGLYIASAMSGAKPMAIFKQLIPFILAVFAVLVLLSWAPILTTGLIR